MGVDVVPQSVPWMDYLPADHDTTPYKQSSAGSAKVFAGRST